jgi:hypothetical protein
MVIHDQGDRPKPGDTETTFDQTNRECGEVWGNLIVQNGDLRKLNLEQRGYVKDVFISHLIGVLKGGDSQVQDAQLAKSARRINKLLCQRIGFPTQAAYLDRYEDTLGTIDRAFLTEEEEFDSQAFAGWAFTKAFSLAQEKKDTSPDQLDGFCGICYIMEKLHPELGRQIGRDHYTDYYQRFITDLNNDTILRGHFKDSKSSEWYEPIRNFFDSQSRYSQRFINLGQSPNYPPSHLGFLEQIDSVVVTYRERCRNSGWKMYQ